MDLSKLSDRERLAAEQAVLTLRALDPAADAAPQGQGLAYLEAAITDKGFEHLRNMMSLSICAITDAEKVGAGWGRMSKQMRLATKQVVHVIADGAKWIWEQAGGRLPKHNGKWCVDVYHVNQHIHQCARDMFGENAQARQWADEHLMMALKSNGPALIRQIQQEQTSATRRTS